MLCKILCQLWKLPATSLLRNTAHGTDRALIALSFCGLETKCPIKCCPFFSENAVLRLRGFGAMSRLPDHIPLRVSHCRVPSRRRSRSLGKQMGFGRDSELPEECDDGEIVGRCWVPQWLCREKPHEVGTGAYMHTCTHQTPTAIRENFVLL